MKQILILCLASIFVFACTTFRPESLNSFGEALVIAELDYACEADVDSVFINNLADSMAPSTVQQASGDRYIFLADSSSREQLIAELSSQKAVLTVFQDPFYNFNLSDYSGSVPVPNLTHVLMTCNMVDDSLRQSEYLDYHKRQKELFPEVAKGFSRAGYEQVLVYRDGKRLMLVISFPQGEKLDELDPLTTKDNPRVDEWNSIMATYQENIDCASCPPWMMYQNVN